MEIAKYIFLVVASITLFGLIGGLSVENTIPEMLFKAVVVGLILGSAYALKEAKNLLLSKI
jgi:hypothetical protein